MTPIQQLMLGVGGATKTYMEDVFSNYLYEGTSADSHVINNGIDLAGNGGFVWVKKRSGIDHHVATHAAGKILTPNTTEAEHTGNTGFIESFNNNGFTLGGGVRGSNSSGDTIASWTFRKAPGFFDVVTYTGNGTSGRTISHALDGYVGSLWVKCTSDAENWAVWHRYLNGGSPTGYALRLNSNSDEFSGNGYFPSNPSTSNFTVGSVDDVNGNGKTYVALIFGQDNQVFGANENQGIIDCSEYTGNGSATGPTISCGWEPQWVLIKRVDTNENWFLWDSMRGIVTDGNDSRLIVNSNGAEDSTADRIDLTSRGFQLKSTSGEVNANGGTYIYIAIRRPDGYVGKPAKLGTDVFAMDTGDGNPSALPTMESNFPVDFGTIKLFASSQGWYTGARLSGDNVVFTNSYSAESSNSILEWDSNKGFWKSLQSTYQGWMWKRHAGFDVVCDVGTGGAKNVNHSLGQVPEMIWRKNRGSGNATAGKWVVYHKDLPVNGSDLGYAYLNLDNAAATYSQYWTQTPTSTVFSVGTDGDLNQNNENYINLLFSSVNGISKIGGYTGPGNNDLTITTGFQPRFIMIKNASNAYGWAVFDTLRGIGTGSSDDKRLLFNSDAAQTSGDDLNITSTGFTLKGNGWSGLISLNSKFIYYAHA